MNYIQNFELGVPIEIIVKYINPKQGFKRWIPTVAFHTLELIPKKIPNFIWNIVSFFKIFKYILFRNAGKSKKAWIFTQWAYSIFYFWSPVSQLSQIFCDNT